MNVPRADPVNVFVTRLDGERATLARLHTPHMGPRCFEFGRDDGPHPVARLEACDLLLPHLVAARKSFLRPVGSAMVAPSGGLDHQRFELTLPHACQIPDAQGIKCMGLLDSEPRPVPPCPPACPRADGQPKDAQGLNKLVSAGIDRRCIAQRHFGLLLDLRMPPFGGCLIPFLLIAAVTGQRQIRDTVGPATAAGPDMVYFKGRLPLPTIGASVLILEQQIGSHLPPGQFAVLVFHPLDFRVLEQVRVEAHLLDLDAADGRPASEAIGPRDEVFDPGEDRRRQPALRDGPVVKTRCAVSQIGAAPSPPSVGLGLFVLMDLLSTVSHFRKINGVMHLSLWGHFSAGKRHPACPAARIDLEGKRLQERVFHTPIAESDDEGRDPVDDCPAASEQESCSFGCAGHERFFVSV